MHRIDDRLVLSPTDLTKHLACPHVTTLDLEVADGARARPEAEDDALTLVFALGLAHEKAYLEALRAQGRSIVEITTAFDAQGREAAELATVEAMRSGVDVVYQATFFDGSWGGQADFLLRVDEPSALGAWSYEVADTKLARRMKVPALLQMALYAGRLAQLQGRAPRHLYVVTGDGKARPWRLVDVASYARRVHDRLSAFVVERPLTAPVPVAHCAQCRWLPTCQQRWAADDDLSLVAFMRRDHRDALRRHGIATVAGLAAAIPDELPRSIGRSSRERLVEQAAQQVRERLTGTPSYVLLPPAPGLGLLRLPAPSPGDLYLDFEGDPHAEGGQGREYLAGLGDRSGRFTPWWAHDWAAERRLTIELVDRLLAGWRADPGMHVYHYAPYETAALKRLTARHGVREAELDQLLRGERFVDLYAVVRQGMRISKGSYSIKKMEAFYRGVERPGDDDVADALASVVAYERWLVERDDTVLEQIADYNRDDVTSTRELHDWLEIRRGELSSYDVPLPRPDEVDADPDRPLSDLEIAEAELAERLRASGHTLMADLVQWHRREARPAWWDFFRLGELDDDALVDDGTALGPLSAPELVGADKRSRLWRYRFAPQDTRVQVGKDVHDIDDHGRAGTVVELDPVAGFVVVKLQADPLASRGFGPPKPPDDKVLRAAISAAGDDLLVGRRSLAHALLDRIVPPDTLLAPGERPADAVVRIAMGMSGTVLAVQGPPGSGKTYVGARLIRELLDQGKRVGVTATSHAVIGHLLTEVDRPALHKCGGDQHCGGPLVTRAATNQEVADAVASGSTRLFGGTAWLWSRPELADALDVLVVDEAGQLSLANAVAVARSARSMVLLGDPQQLSQPSQAQHPGGAGASALEHLLDGHETIPPERGVFLDTSRRMHPEISGFISDLAYDGRLSSEPWCDRQTVLAGGAVSGGGLRVMTVEHTGNAARSTEEARAVRDLWTSLQGISYVDRDGATRPLGAEDVLVVAPYNNQVGEIARMLPRARVGTVDKFQGQEAPVVIYSMTSSSAEDAPRGVEFLYDVHRLNVAVSRAQALAVVVLNPALLDAPVTTPEQLRRVNALCRLVEQAQQRVV